MVDFLPNFTFATEYQKRREVRSLDEEERIFTQVTLQKALWHQPEELVQTKPLGFQDKEQEQSEEDEDSDEMASQEGEEEEESMGVDQEADDDDYGVQQPEEDVYDWQESGQVMQGISGISGYVSGQHNASSSLGSLGVMPVPFVGVPQFLPVEEQDVDEFAQFDNNQSSDEF